MEVIFLLAGLLFIGIGVAIIVSEIKARRGTEGVSGQVIGFARGKSSLSQASFHSVAEFIAPNGCKYYVQGSVGSSVPLHVVGDSVTVRVLPLEPQSAILQSKLSFILGGALLLMGAVCVLVFWLTFRASMFSLVTAAVVGCGIALKARKVWRKQPLSLEAWREFKKQSLSAEVFESKDQISWADPASMTSALQNYHKSNRFAVPVLLVLGSGLLIFSFYAYRNEETFLQRADRTSGRVVDTQARSDSDGETTYAAVVEFTDPEGQTYRHTDAFSASTPLYQRGQEVTILYERAHPVNAQIDHGRWNHWLSLLLGIFGSLFVALGLSSARRRSRSYLENRTA